MTNTNITLTAEQIGLLLGLLHEVDQKALYTTPQEFTVHAEVEAILEDAENAIYTNA